MAGSNEEIPHGSQPVESGIVLGPSSSQNPNSQPPILETAIGNGNGTEPQQAAVNDDQIDAAVAGSGPALPFGAKRPLKSNVWPHFIRFLDKNNEMKARCKYCKKVLGGDTNNGTTHLRNHTTRCIQRQLHDGTQKNIKTNFLPKGVLGKKELCSGQYNAEVARKDLATMIGMVDHLYFKIFCASLQPLFKVPCRNTLKRDILATYDVERKKIQKGIDSNKGRIAVTTDMWTATNQKRGYMAITGHYIDNGGKLRNHLLSFPYVPAPHTSAKLATVLRECLMDWNVDMHMRCSAHVLNLIVKDGLDIIKEGIDKVRDSVVYWTATPRRVEFFEEAAKQKNISFSKKLVLDCPTRWNSTFHMLSTAIPYKDVFVRLRQREPQYTSLPSANDWSFAAIVCQKLEVLSNISVLFSGDQYPTSNLFFPKICDLKLKLMEWKSDSDAIISAMATKMWTKFSKYWSEIHLLLAVAVVIDPRYKLELVEYYAAKFGTSESTLDPDYVKGVMYTLVREYQLKHASAVGDSSGSSSVSVPASESDIDFELYLSRKKRAKPSSVNSELDHYLDEDVIPRSRDIEFDILGWWRANAAKYPTLHEIARDILAVPITSVASESAFSSGGRLLDPHRSRLHFKTVEALMCTRSWIKDGICRESGNVNAALHGLESCFSTLTMEDASWEEFEKGDLQGSNRGAHTDMDLED
ncbi:Zinc finger BED domain-containing protein RICESLEEPER 2 [Linum grandiflorum]